MNKQKIYWEAKEVAEVSDPKKAALLLQDGRWVATNATINEDLVTFIFIRIS